MAQLGIAKVLELASKEKTREAKITFLRNNFSATLADVIKLAYHPAVKWLLPAGAPPYTINDLPEQDYMLFREIKKFYLFLDGGGNHLTQMKREQMFMDVLSKVSPKDAELILAMKDGYLPYDMTYDLVWEAFPDLLPEPEEKKE